MASTDLPVDRGARLRVARARAPARAVPACGVALAALLALAGALPGCATTADASSSAGGPGAASPSAARSGDARLGVPPIIATVTTAPLAGARCQGASCRCRETRNDDEETSPPSAMVKRFEIRMSADGGTASMEISGMGALTAAGNRESCYYVDMEAGSSRDVVFAARESTKDAGIAPVLKIAEYGPAGRYWYEVMTVRCDGPDGRCDRRAADHWGQIIRERKRGRADPCGSAVLRNMGWDTSRTQGDREGGLFHDFAVRFTMDVKKFATQFAPGSKECASN